MTRAHIGDGIALSAPLVCDPDGTISASPLAGLALESVVEPTGRTAVSQLLAGLAEAGDQLTATVPADITGGLFQSPGQPGPAPLITVTATRLPGVDAMTLVTLHPVDPHGEHIATCPDDARIRADAHEWIVLTDSAGKASYVSPQVTDLLARGPEEMRDRSVELIHPVDLATQFRYAFGVQEGPGATGRCRVRLRHGDGSWRWADLDAVNLVDHPGVRGVVHVIRVAGPSALDEWVAEAELSLTWHRASQAGHAVLVHDHRDRIVLASPALRGLWQLDPAALLGHPIHEVVRPAEDDDGSTHDDSGDSGDGGDVWHDRDISHGDHVTVVAEPGASLADGSPGTNAARSVRHAMTPRRVRVRTGTGRLRWAEGHRLDLRDDPEVGGVVWTLTDVHDQVEADLALRASEERFRALVQNAAAVVATYDAEQRVTYVSPGIEQVTGFSTGATLGTNLLALTHPDDVAIVTAAWDQALTNPGSIVTSVARVITRDGQVRWLTAQIENRFHDPAVGAMVANYDDITERQAAEEAARVSEARYRALVQSAQDLITVVGADGIITWASPSAPAIVGYAPEELQGQHGIHFVHEDDRPACHEMMARICRRPGSAEALLCRVLRKDGSLRLVEATATNHLATPAVEGVVWNLRDITEHIDALQQSARLTEILEATTDLVAVGQLDVGFTYANAALRRFIGLDPDQAASSISGELAAALLPASQWETEVLPALESEGVWSGEFPLVNRHGQRVPFSTVLMRHTGADGQTVLVSGISRDMSDRKAFEATLEHQATHDPLTGLPNRTLLLDRLEVALGRARRTRSSVAVLFLDLDHFKVINDSLGHGAGDQLLVTLAGQLTTLVRPGDTVARFGGDEFLVLCEDMSDEDEVRVVAQRIAETVAAPAVVGDAEVVVTCSVGIAFARGGSVDAESLIRDADAAMYQAKARGRARAEVFDSGMRANVVDRLELASALRRAIEHHELRVYYQPFLDIASGRIVGAEALLRWSHPERGLLLPGEFLAVAEETKLIVPIGLWVARQACLLEQRAACLLPEYAPLRVSVNLSGQQLSHPTLVEDLAAVLEETGGSGHHLDIELTEDVLMDDVAVTAHTLRRLKKLGVRLAVDDFGTGYSSLAYLKRFPVDVLKVDRTFVAGLCENAEDRAIVTAVVNLAHTLGLSAIAEGVETADQLAELSRLGCDLAQGNHVGRPMTDHDLLELLA